MPLSITITDTQQFDIVVTGAVDKVGNPTNLTDPVTATSEDETKVTVGPQVDASGTPTGLANAFTVKAVEAPGDLGAVQIALAAGKINDAVNVTVQAGDAVGFAATLGTPTEQP